MVRILATALIGLICSSSMASIIVTPSVSYTHNALTSVAHVKFYAGGDTASRSVSSFEFDFSTLGFGSGLTGSTFASVDASSFWRGTQFSVSTSNPTNILRITGAKGPPIATTAPATGINAVNEIAAFDLTFNRPAAGTSDLVFSRTGPTDYSGTFIETDGADLPLLPNVGLTPSYPGVLSITIPQQLAGGGGGGAAVPEPGSVLAISAVLGGLGLRALRRRRQGQVS
ncbi:MAG: hypothetical protein ACK5ES_04655 [Planctomyces sp.]